MNKKVNIPERRVAVRITCQTPLAFKICKDETISKIMQGYTQNISSDGIKCAISEKVPLGSTLWLKLNKDAISMCEELEKRSVILQQGILGIVVWCEKKEDNIFDIGVQFLTREEPNLFNVDRI